MNSFEHNNPQILQKNPWTSIFYLVLLFIGWNLFSQLIGLGLAVLLTEINFMEAESIMQPPFSSESKKFLYIAQGVSHFLGFTVFSLFFIKIVDKISFSHYLNRFNINLSGLILVPVITFTFMIFNSVVIEWNANIEFPEFMQGFADWARGMEDRLMAVTEALSTYANVNEMLVALIIIGVLPAIGEELVFRGLLQNKLLAATSKAHLAIWVTAIIFGAFHMQFFGVFPRILLGALFGYIYYYSGNIWYPILAHFVNNGLAVIVMYFGPRYIDDWDVQEIDSSVPIYVSAIALIICTGLFFIFIKNLKFLKEK